MENKGKIKKSKLSAFRKSTFPRHFEAAKNSVVNDPLGSYTGTPISFGDDDTDDMVPTQDADDL